jgi:hypothetical protein
MNEKLRDKYGIYYDDYIKEEDEFIHDYSDSISGYDYDDIYEINIDNYIELKQGMVVEEYNSVYTHISSEHTQGFDDRGNFFNMYGGFPCDIIGYNVKVYDENNEEIVIA